MNLAQVAWAPGTQFSRYEIMSRLARGGMAEVWRAAVTGMAGFHREVVIKTMRPELAVSEDLVRMFINEARIAARLNHPSIMQVFDFGQLDSRYFIAMEYVAGPTLRQLARSLRALDRRVPRRFLVRVLTETARALGYAHALTENGEPLAFAHRDVSPENIMISIEGSAKLIDFGAAVTRTCPPPPKTFVGKYRYLPPERVQGADGDARGDVYSLGVVLYEYLTGRRPFDGPQIKKLILAGNPPDPCRLVPNLPRRLGGIISKAIALNPNDRFANGTEFANELTLLLERDLGDDPKVASEAEVSQLLRSEPPPPPAIRPQTEIAVAGYSGLAPTSVVVVVSDPTDTDAEADVEVMIGAQREDAPVERAPAIERNQFATVAPDSTLSPENCEPSRSLSTSAGASVPSPAVDRQATPGPNQLRPSGGRESRPFDADPGRVSTPDPFSIVRRSLPDLRPPPGWFSSANGSDTPRKAPPAAAPVAQSTNAPDSTEATLNNQSAAAYFERGLELVARQEFDAAVDLWRRATALDPQRRSYRTNLERLERRIAKESGTRTGATLRTTPENS